MNVHVLALDGTYTFEGERRRFHRAPPLTTLELEHLLDPLIRRINRTLVGSGALLAQEYDDAEKVWLEPVADGKHALTQLHGASIRQLIAVDPIAGRRTLCLHSPQVVRDTPGATLTRLAHYAMTAAAPHAKHPVDVQHLHAALEELHP